MLKEFEELWEKPITPLVASILKSGGGIATEPDVRKVLHCIVLNYPNQYYAQAAYFDAFIDNDTIKRLEDRTHVITYRVPHNSAVQVWHGLE